MARKGTVGSNLESSHSRFMTRGKSLLQGPVLLYRLRKIGVLLLLCYYLLWHLIRLVNGDVVTTWTQGHYDEGEINEYS